jgi:ribulose 1,5-bisphosphate carboxylase large subunit-like protein
VSFDGIVPEFVDQNQIGINLHAIHRLCRLGGIKNLHVVGVNGETSSFTPAVVGMDGKGHALAGWIGTKVEVPTHEVNLGKSDHHVMHAASWIDVRTNCGLKSSGWNSISTSMVSKN